MLRARRMPPRRGRAVGCRGPMARGLWRFARSGGVDLIQNADEETEARVPACALAAQLGRVLCCEGFFGGLDPAVPFVWIGLKPGFHVVAVV